MPVTNIEITGAKSLDLIFKQLPLKYGKKPMVSAFRKSAKAFVSVLKRNTPVDTGATKKAIKVKALRGAAITVGFQAGKGKMPEYMKAYWANYGTLTNRVSGHQFKKGRKSKSSGWAGGIRAGGFVESSWDQTKNQVQNNIETNLKLETMKFLNKHKVA